MQGPMRVRLWLWLMISSVLSPVVFAQTQGLPQDWEIRADIDALARQTTQLKLLIEEVKPDQWPEQDSRDAYKAQLKSVLDEIGYLSRSEGELASNPERLSLAFETYLRIQSLDEMTSSLNEGVRRYQDPQLADRIRAAQTGAAAPQEKLRNYIVLLAANRESQYEVMAEEAQRCRAALSRQAPARGGTAKKTESK